MKATNLTYSLKALAFAVMAGGFAILGGSPVWAASPGSAWEESYFPNPELVTQDGEKVRFYDDLLKGKVFAINFIYTRCTDSCPLETAALRKVQKALGERMGRDVFFYTISIDGDRDHPAELKAYAKKFNVGPGWTFLSGSAEDVKEIRQRLGMYRDDGQPEQALNEHNTNFLMGNERAGQWIKRSPFEETGALIRILTTRLQNKPGIPVDNMAALPSGRPHSAGEGLFRANCSACHSLDGEDGLGPGLAGVTQHRDPVWLKRWIKEPDKMIAEQDPAALALYRQYQELPMPNLRLDDVDVEAILIYLRAHEQTAADN